MDFPLRLLEEIPEEEPEEEVSILVVVDFPLRLLQNASFLIKFWVSILVVVDFPLRQTLMQWLRRPFLCFNPCCSGFSFAT